MILPVKKILPLITRDIEITAHNTTFEDEYTRAYIRINFGNQAFLYENDDETETAQDVANAFFDIWLMYNHMYYDSLNRSMIALEAEYNPIENYDRHEISDDTETKKPDERTYSYNTTTTTTDGLYSEKTTVSAYDTSLKDEREVQKGHIPGHSDTDVKTGNDYVTDTFGDKTTTRTSRIHGNVGVTTNQAMLSAELELRKYNLFADYINRFIRQYCFTYWGCRDADCIL